MAWFRFVFPATALEVRTVLDHLFERNGIDLPASLRIPAQIVLAEALNNIVEHAYPEHPGQIELAIEGSQGGLRCVIRDTGLPMPPAGLPSGILPVPFDSKDLPEGGFGWHLIRSLAEDLSYQREGSGNCLCFRIPGETVAH